MDTFYLGTHQPGWLATANMPLFVSHRRLAGYKTLPRAAAPWALDSGGFSELQLYGGWRTTPEQYVAAVRRYDTEIGRLEWCAPQDWMCEPIIIAGGQAGPNRFAGTHLSVAEHQARTIANFVQLRDLWWAGDADAQAFAHLPDACPFVPVLQGFEPDDYRRHADAWHAAGIALEDYPIVGLGSVCRRQATSQIDALIREFTPTFALHGFGCKTAGLARYGHRLTSADSLAWSYAGRREPAGCSDTHKNEANCLRYALAWRQEVLAVLDQPEQLELEATA